MRKLRRDSSLSVVCALCAGLFACGKEDKFSFDKPTSDGGQVTRDASASRMPDAGNPDSGSSPKLVAPDASRDGDSGRVQSADSGLADSGAENTAARDSGSSDGGNKQHVEASAPEPDAEAPPDAAPELTAEDALAGDGFIAYVGCTQSAVEVEGYRQAGGTRLYSYSSFSSTVLEWVSPDSDSWQYYDEQIEIYGEPVAVWFQICVVTEMVLAEAVSVDDIAAVVDNIRAQHPDSPLMPVFISGLESFDPRDSCELADGDTTSLTQQWARDVAASKAGVFEGPVLGPLTPELTIVDGCHHSPDGELLTGQQMFDFFH